MKTFLEALAAMPLRQTALVALIVLLALTWLAGLFGPQEVLQRIDWLLGIQHGGIPR